MNGTPPTFAPGTTHILPPSDLPATGDLQRLDVLLSRRVPAYSRTFFQKLITQGCVQVNNTVVAKSSAPVPEDSAITIAVPGHQTSIPTPQQQSHADVQILLEHPHFIVINKPAGLLVHRAFATSTQYTLVDWLTATVPALATHQGEERPGIIHRLDKETSGALLIATDPRAQHAFMKMFQDRTISKTYLALVHGEPPQSGSITTNIIRHPTERTRMTHSKTRGKQAHTDYKVLQYFEEHTLVEARPLTGRTHQIRVHFASIGHPVVGDRVYGYRDKRPLGRHMLHAWRLEFTYDGQEYVVEAPIPTDLKTAVAPALSRN